MKRVRIAKVYSNNRKVAHFNKFNCPNIENLSDEQLQDFVISNIGLNLKNWSITRTNKVVILKSDNITIRIKVCNVSPQFSSFSNIM